MICQAWLVLLGQFCVVQCTDVFYLVKWNHSHVYTYVSMYR